MSGEQAESLKIEPVDNYILLDNRVPGYIDSAFDFTMSGNFETATISFEFDVAGYISFFYIGYVSEGEPLAVGFPSLLVCDKRKISFSHFLLL